MNRRDYEIGSNGFRQEYDVKAVENYDGAYTLTWRGKRFKYSFIKSLDWNGIKFLFPSRYRVISMYDKGKEIPQLIKTNRWQINTMGEMPGTDEERITFATEIEKYLGA